MAGPAPSPAPAPHWFPYPLPHPHLHPLLLLYLEWMLHRESGNLQSGLCLLSQFRCPKNVTSSYHKPLPL